MIKTLNTKPFDLQRMLGRPMSYSPVEKSEKMKLANLDNLYAMRQDICDRYRNAILADDYSDYDDVYRLYEYYIENGGNNHYLSVVMKDYKNQYERQQSQEIDELQKHCVKDLISAIYDCETITAEIADKKLVEFNRQVYDTYMLPMAKAIDGTELNCHNIAKTKPKSFEEMSRDEKIEFVNKQIDDLLDFIETNKQAKYNAWKKEFYND